ncbi:hypothetical protein KOR42_50210 [Thalassoglobus neptunius]|uniref:EF-hand domain-containing protein n=1 Tax=Thalassoglobus neptunius TaxID=1938619 RepID=A0A5C5VN25_9PLAN|nr:hypothetical protein [Thalassoglobus neptunius]TWT40054.1 hypothetical protein KOR42_50210 [Thalassoglobus neptunius]
MKRLVSAVFCLVSLSFCVSTYAQDSDAKLKRWLKRFPDADTNQDGKLSTAEAESYIKQRQASRSKNVGAPRVFAVDPGWKEERFPEHAVCYKSPDEIAKLYAKQLEGSEPVVRYAKPSDGSLRIVGNGHSFMAPGYKTFPVIVEAAGLKQPPLLTHTGGGMTGSTRYKWEQENGIFGFDGKPTQKLLSSIANSEWDAMMWGPYFNDHPEYYSCWIDFCLKYNPDMKFYLSDAWPQLSQLNEIPKSEEKLTPEVIAQLGEERFEAYSKIINELNEQYGDRVFIMPTCEAMVQCVKYFDEGKLPGIDGIHKAVGNQERSLWRDQLGHLGPGLDRLEGYVFYATLYGRNPQNIPGDIFEDSQFPNQTLDRRFREIAWQAVLRNPLSGVVDKNENGIADDRE